MWQLHDYIINVRIVPAKLNWHGSDELAFYKDGYKLFGRYIPSKGFEKRNARITEHFQNDTILLFTWED